MIQERESPHGAKNWNYETRKQKNPEAHFG